MLAHPATKVRSVKRAVPREDTRGHKPKCRECATDAEVTVEFELQSSSGNIDLCQTHLTNELANPIVAAKVLAAFLADHLPK